MFSFVRLSSKRLFVGAALQGWDRVVLDALRRVHCFLTGSLPWRFGCGCVSASGRRWRTSRGSRRVDESEIPYGWTFVAREGHNPYLEMWLLEAERLYFCTAGGERGEGISDFKLKYLCVLVLERPRTKDSN